MSREKGAQTNESNTPIFAAARVDALGSFPSVPTVTDVIGIDSRSYADPRNGILVHVAMAYPLFAYLYVAVASAYGRSV